MHAETCRLCQVILLLLSGKPCLIHSNIHEPTCSYLRELVSYRGEKDPFKGDSLNQRVRDMAKEIISEVLYVAPPQQGSSMSLSSGRVG